MKYRLTGIIYQILAHDGLLHYLAAALQMSMQESTSNPSSQADESKVLEDQSFVSSVLASVSLVESAFCNIEL